MRNDETPLEPGVRSTNRWHSAGALQEASTRKEALRGLARGKEGLGQSGINGPGEETNDMTVRHFKENHGAGGGYVVSERGPRYSQRLKIYL